MAADTPRGISSKVFLEVEDSPGRGLRAVDSTTNGDAAHSMSSGGGGEQNGEVDGVAVGISPHGKQEPGHAKSGRAALYVDHPKNGVYISVCLWLMTVLSSSAFMTYAFKRLIGVWQKTFLSSGS